MSDDLTPELREAYTHLRATSPTWKRMSEIEEHAAAQRERLATGQFQTGVWEEIFLQQAMGTEIDRLTRQIVKEVEEYLDAKPCPDCGHVRGWHTEDYGCAYEGGPGITFVELQHGKCSCTRTVER